MIHNHTVPVLDGGPCTVGVESTILDLSVQPPAIRRLGAIEKRSTSLLVLEIVAHLLQVHIKPIMLLRLHYCYRQILNLTQHVCKPKDYPWLVCDLQIAKHMHTLCTLGYVNWTH